MSSFFRHLAVIGSTASLILSSSSVQASSLQDYTAVFTPENIARLLPGFTASDYSNMANLLQAEIPGNADCVSSFNLALGPNPIDEGPAIDSCKSFIDSRKAAYGFTAINFDPLAELFGLVGATQYVATVSPQIVIGSVTSYIDTVTQVLHSVGGRTHRGGPSRFPIGGVKGMAGGDVATRMNGWVSANLNETRNTFGLSSHVGVLGNIMGGVDYRVDSQLTAGVSGGYDYSYVKTIFSNGVMEGQGFTLAPYVSYQFNPSYNLDAIVGYSLGKTSINSRVGAGTSGNQDYSRQFVAANLNAIHWMGDWQASGKLGYIYASEKTDGTQALGTRDVRNTMQQMRLSGQIGYWMDSWMPYVGLTYTQDIRLSYQNLIPEAMRDGNSYTLTLGVDLYSKSGWNGGVVLTSEIDRKFIRNNALLANLNYRF
jgi:hypothetical protein